MTELISLAYREMIRSVHQDGTQWGRGGYLYADDVTQLCKELQAQSVLDYGCGMGTLAEKLRDSFVVSEYDPGIPGKDELPAPADVVACTDVLEHVERECLEAVLQHIRILSKTACFAAICCRPADRILPDGQNAHLIVKNWKWWLERFNEQPWRKVKVKKIENNVVSLIAYT